MAMTYRNFIHNARAGVVFAYVPKVACTNWKGIMRHMEGHADYLDNRLAHDRARGGLTFLDPDTAEDRRLLDTPGLRKFAFVRDPLSRSLSAYLNKVASRLPLGPETPDEEYFRRVTRRIEAFRTARLDPQAHPAVDFGVFLLWLRDSGDYARLDEHWQSQTRLLRAPHIRFDILGRFERLAEDAPRVLAEMGCDIPFPSQQDVKFSPTEATRKLAQYVGPREAALVAGIYREDFENFGYPVPDPAAFA